jgi:hypothetical protein
VIDNDLNMLNGSVLGMSDELTDLGWGNAVGNAHFG